MSTPRSGEAHDQMFQRQSWVVAVQWRRVEGAIDGLCQEYVTTGMCWVDILYDAHTNWI